MNNNFTNGRPLEEFEDSIKSDCLKINEEKSRPLTSKNLSKNQTAYAYTFLRGD